MQGNSWKLTVMRGICASKGFTGIDETNTMFARVFGRSGSIPFNHGVMGSSPTALTKRNQSGKFEKAGRLIVAGDGLTAAGDRGEIALPDGK